MKYLRNQKGSSLLMILFIMVVLSIFGIALWTYSTAEIKQVFREENNMKAYYLARSGINMGYYMLSEHYEEVQQQDFYMAGSPLYNNSTDDMIMEFDSYDGDFTEEIVVVVQWEEQGGTIIAYGQYQDSQYELKRPFVYSLDPEDLIIPPEDALDAIDIGWVKPQGKLDPGNNPAQDKPVKVQKRERKTIYKAQDNSHQNHPFVAPAIYFLDDPSLSLEGQKNNTRKVYFAADLFIFHGEILFGNGEMILETDESDLQGEEIDEDYEDFNGDQAQIGKTYGVIYFETDLQGVDLEGDFFYFPDEINLSDKNELQKLIRIEDLSTIDLSELHLDFLLKSQIEMGDFE